MGKLYFHYSTMNAGKSTMLLQAAHNYMERGMICYMLTAQLDTRAGEGKITSRIGLSMDANTYAPQEDLYAKLSKVVTDSEPFSCAFVDEAQFLSKEQVWQLARFVDDFNIPVMCYGLRTDFRGELFPGSAALLAIADEMREVRTICHCGKKASMALRRTADGAAASLDGEQVQIGGNDVYVSLCRRHWREEVGDVPAMPLAKGSAAPAGKRALGAKENEDPASPGLKGSRAGAVETEGGVAIGAGGDDDKGVESPK